jgi:hypothetical protein
VSDGGIADGYWPLSSSTPKQRMRAREFGAQGRHHFPSDLSTNEQSLPKASLPQRVFVARLDLSPNLRTTTRKLLSVRLPKADSPIGDNRGVHGFFG